MSQLDGFALKTLYQCSSYHSFYTYLVEQLDFTKLTGGTAKASGDLLWRILGYLPPSVEYLGHASTYTDSGVSVAFISIGEEDSSGEIHRRIALRKKQHCLVHLVSLNCRRKTTQSSVFDLIVYQILLQNLSPSKEEIHQLSIGSFSINLKRRWNEILIYKSSPQYRLPNLQKKTTTTVITLPTLPTDFEEL